MKTTTDYHRLPLTDWFYSIEHSNLSPGIHTTTTYYIPDSTNYKSTASGANKYFSIFVIANAQIQVGRCAEGMFSMFCQIKPQRQNQSTSGHKIYQNMISDQQGQSKQCIKGISGISADPEMSYTTSAPAKILLRYIQQQL